MPVNKQKNLRVRFTAMLKATEKLLQAIEELKASQQNDSIGSQLEKFSAEKLATIHDANELAEFIEKRDAFYADHKAELDTLKTKVEAIDEANAIFFNSARDYQSYKQDVVNGGVFTSDEKEAKYKKKWSNYASNMQIDVINKRYKNPESKESRAIKSNELWAEDNAEAPNADRSLQMGLVKQATSKAKIFMATLAAERNLNQLQEQREYYTLRLRLDSLRSFFVAEANISRHEQSLQEQRQRQENRVADDKYAEEGFEEALDTTALEIAKKQIQMDARIIKGEVSYYDTAVLFGEDDVDAKNKGKEKEDDDEPDIRKIISSHHAIRHQISRITVEISRVMALEAELKQKIMNWKYPPDNFPNESEKSNKELIGKLENKAEKLRIYRESLQAEKDTYNKEYYKLAETVKNRIEKYFSKNKEKLAEFDEYKDEISDLRDKIKKITNLISLDLAKEYYQQFDLTQGFYIKLATHPELKHIAEWSEYHPDAKIENSVYDIAKSLQSNRDELSSCINIMLAQVEDELLRFASTSNGIEAKNIVDHVRLRSNLITLIADDLFQWNKYLYSRTQEKSLSSTERDSQLNEYGQALHNLTHYVMQDIIVNNPGIDRRTYAVDRWLNVMRVSERLGDNQAVTAIRNALNDPAIRQLEKTWMGLSDQDKEILARSDSPATDHKIPSYNYLQANQTIPLPDDNTDEWDKVLRRSDSEADVRVNNTSMLQAMIMKVKDDATTVLAAAIAQQEKTHFRGKTVGSDSGLEPVQPSTLTALIATKNQEGKLLYSNDSNDRLEAILNPMIRKIASEKKYFPTDQFIHDVNTAARNPGGSKSITRIMTSHKFTIDSKTKKQTVADVERDNKQIYYHSLIQNKVLGEMLKDIKLKSDGSKYKRTLTLIGRINNAITAHVDDDTLKNLLRQIGFLTIQDDQIKAIQDENVRLRTVTARIAVDNPGLSAEEIEEKSSSWLQKNRSSYITSATLYSPPRQKVRVSDKKDLPATNELSLTSQKEFIKKLLAVLKSLQAILVAMDSQLDHLLKEKRAFGVSNSEMGLFAKPPEQSKSNVEVNESKTPSRGFTPVPGSTDENQ